MDRKKRLLGTVFGGAIGDAIGFPIEFYKYEDILDFLNGMSLREKVVDGSSELLISDDTQMTLFTIEGLIRSYTRGIRRGICHGPTVIYFAYLRWLHTQGETTQYMHWDEDKLNGWLIQHKELYSRRVPGLTCISALHEGVMGTIEKPINNSKGCGGVMRVAPIGYHKDRDIAYKLAKEVAAITHSHPSGYISAGALSVIIYSLVEGKNIEESIAVALDYLSNETDGIECIEKIEAAISLSQNGEAHVENIKRIGEGWVAEEALGIAVYCSLIHTYDLEKAITIAALHDGDSDSTASIAGNIVGTIVGIEGIPTYLMEKIELRDIIEELCIDLDKKHEEGDFWFKKYPGN